MSDNICTVSVMNMENITFILAFLNALIAFLGVAFFLLAFVEWRKAKAAKEDMQKFKEDIHKKLHVYFNAASKVQASYNVADINARIKLLEIAVQIEPRVYNGFNALAYVYIENGDTAKAIDVLTQALTYYPKDIATLSDLAYAHLTIGNIDLCLKYLNKTIKIDPRQREIIQENPQFSSIVYNF